MYRMSVYVYVIICVRSVSMKSATKKGIERIFDTYKWRQKSLHWKPLNVGGNEGKKLLRV